jgi:hypothetical protein
MRCMVEVAKSKHSVNIVYKVHTRARKRQDIEYNPQTIILSYYSSYRIHRSYTKHERAAKLSIF